ncbi:spore germination protein [Cytobacillus sp. IB215316]|uniref:spore germination protein n=1 Tax=Cytobacillus sp. IB215316 TaxID=3097354 RepID=UPI002A12AA29|nr:spore germination protein [Cytobacillus sp. IB215316]MDX8360431.1 spore germination protein [Cytobacillus sp. IB215316]
MFTFFKKRMKNDTAKKKTSDNELEKHDSNPEPTYSHIEQQFTDCTDISKKYCQRVDVRLIYFEYMVDKQTLNSDVIDKLEDLDPEEVHSFLQQSQFQPSHENKEVVKAILDGNAAIFHENNTYIFEATKLETRAIQTAESETIITGPHDALNELIDTNLSLIRRRVKSSHLKVLKLSVGEIGKSNVYLLYIDGIADQQIVQDAKTRIENIEIDAIYDVNMLVQLIDESPNSPFPQFHTTERPDVISSKLTEGKVVGMMENSPYAFSAPTSFFDFFQSTDDYNQRWLVGSATRLLRLFALFVTVSFTALYVSITTYHYEMVPDLLLISLITSRSNVPFPPIMEALLMEFTIELLREAGARLPTKIGQTIGIVGGIVIGSASVDAGITSNILIIAVSISAISSFVIPSYVMSNSIRIIRFGFILLAGLLGNLGIVFGIACLVIHLTGLTNLKAPYFWPISPTNPSGWKDTIIRGPLSIFNTRPNISSPTNDTRKKLK